LPKIAIIAALEHELRPLIKHWPQTRAQHDGHSFVFYESTYAAAVCSGIGPQPGRRAAEAIIAKYSPEILISAGIAGGLTPELKLGETIFPATVIDARDSSRHRTSIHHEQKLKLGKAYGAHAVDMEGASVARAAEAHGLPFVAIKSISDVVNFELPEMMPFFRDGQFQTLPFVLHITLRPWLWPQVFRLARNTKLASENLCAWLRESALTNTILPGVRVRTGEAPETPTTKI
jgi:nucleoside phosphorylase